jgi:hypothetical protein
MGVLAVTRINPQQLRALQVSTANADVAFALENAMMGIGSPAQPGSLTARNTNGDFLGGATFGNLRRQASHTAPPRRWHRRTPVSIQYCLRSRAA